MSAKPRTAVQQFPRVFRVLKDDWNTTGGQSLRALIWSLFNGRVSVPLWDAWTDLDWDTQRDFAVLLPMGMDRRAKAIEELLKASGEYDRVDRMPLRWSTPDD